MKQQGAFGVSLSLVAKIDARGAVVDVVEVTSSQASPAFVACLSDVIRAGAFSPPQGDAAATVTIPITFVNQPPP